MSETFLKRRISLARNERVTERECELARDSLNELFQTEFEGNRKSLQNDILMYARQNTKVAALRSTQTWPNDTKTLKNFQDKQARMERGNFEFLCCYLRDCGMLPDHSQEPEETTISSKRKTDSDSGAEEEGQSLGVVPDLISLCSVEELAEMFKDIFHPKTQVAMIADMKWYSSKKEERKH